jgi:5-methylcytosine-specific restriction endonuclease McrA
MVVSQSRRARASRRRAGRMARADNDLTAEQWLAILDAWARCAYCGDRERALQKDCVQPLSRGGRYTLGNVVPACASCNASKSNDEVTSWMRRKRLDERAFLLRFSEVARLLAPPA